VLPTKPNQTKIVGRQKIQHLFIRREFNGSYIFELSL